MKALKHQILISLGLFSFTYTHHTVVSAQKIKKMVMELEKVTWDGVYAPLHPWVYLSDAVFTVVGSVPH